MVVPNADSGTRGGWFLDRILFDLDQPRMVMQAAVVDPASPTFVTLSNAVEFTAN